MRSSLRNKVGLLFKMTVSTVLCVLLIRAIDWGQVRQGFARADMIMLLIALALSAVAILIRSYKWGLLLGIQGARLSLGRLLAVSFMALFFNNFLPGSLGGDITKVIKTVRYTDHRSGALLAVLMEKLTNFLTLLLIVMVAGVVTLNMGGFLPKNQLMIFTGIGFFSLLSMWLAVWLTYRFRVHRIIPWPSIARVAERILSSLSLYGRHGKVLARVIILSLFFFLVNICSTYFFARAVGIMITFGDLVVLVPLIFLINMIPVSINGIGIQEGSFVYLLGQMGVETSPAFLMALLIRMSMLLFSLVGVAVYLYEGSQRAPQEADADDAADRSSPFLLKR